MWLPEGNGYFFERETPDGFQIVRASLNRADGEEVVFSDERQAYPMDSSASARLMLFARLGDSGYEIWAGAAHKQERPVAVSRPEPGSAAYAGRLSPSGKWMAFVAGTEKRRITSLCRLVPGNSGPPVALKDCYRISSGGGFDPEWNPDGRELFYIEAGGRLVSVEVQTGSAFQAGARQTLFGVRGIGSGPAQYRPGFGCSVAPDGKRFLFNMRTAEAENELTVLRR